MNIKKIVKLAFVPASLIALSQTGLPSAIADALPRQLLAAWQLSRKLPKMRM